VREALNHALHWLCCPLGLTLGSRSTDSRLSASRQQERRSEQESRCALLDSTVMLHDAQTQTFLTDTAIPSPESTGCGTHSTLSKPTVSPPDKSESEARCQENDQPNGRNPGPNLASYTDGPNTIITINDGIKDCTAFLLTEETVMLLADVIRKRKGVKSTLRNYREASRTAGIGQEFLDYAPTMLDQATSQEEYNHLKDDIEQRRLENVRDVECKNRLKEELHPKEQDLEESRDELEDVLERILDEAQLCPEPCQESTAHGPETTSSSWGMSEADGALSQRSPLVEDQLAGPDCAEQIQVAQQ